MHVLFPLFYFHYFISIILFTNTHILGKKKKIHFIRENYTSKSCSNCFTIKYDLGANKRFKCNKCELKIDRDLNASKNIFMSPIIS